MGTAMPRLMAAAGGLSLMAKGCSEEEGVMFGSDTTAEVGVVVAPCTGLWGAVLPCLSNTCSLLCEVGVLCVPCHTSCGSSPN